MGGRIKVRLQSAVLYLSPAVFLFFQTDFSRKTVQISQVWVRFREKQSKSIKFGSVFAINSPNLSGLGPFWRKTVQISQVWIRFREKQSKLVKKRFLLAKNDRYRSDFGTDFSFYFFGHGNMDYWEGYKQ